VKLRLIAGTIATGTNAVGRRAIIALGATIATIAGIIATVSAAELIS
jgi:hypothetical protein